MTDLVLFELRSCSSYRACNEHQGGDEEARRCHYKREENACKNKRHNGGEDIEHSRHKKNESYLLGVAFICLCGSKESYKIVFSFEGYKKTKNEKYYSYCGKH